MTKTVTRARPLFPVGISILVGLAVFQLLSACTPLTLAQRAMAGDSAELLALVRSGSISPNDPLPLRNDLNGPLKESPFCILVDQPRITEADLQDMINLGANINQPCNYNTLNPLQSLAWSFQWRDLSLPQESAKVYSRAEFLIARGAILLNGGNTVEDFKKLVTKNQNDFDRKESERVAKKRQEDRESIFSAANLSAIVGVAGVAVNNYAAAKETQSPYQSLPVNATSQRHVQEKQPSGTFSSIRTGNIETVKRGGADSTKIAEAPTAAQRAPTLAIYKFQSSISFRSPKMSEEKARKWVADDRTRMNSPKGIHISYTVNMETPITCHKVDDKVTNPKSICEMTVTWDIVSHENPNMDLKKMSPAQAIQK